MTCERTLAEAAAALRCGSVTSVALTEASIAAADELDERLGTYLARFDEAALAAAARADAELAQGLDRGPLHGIPLAIKDNIATEDGPTTAQSAILDPAWGERGDAPVVARLRAAGAPILGKTTTMEFAIGVPDPSAPFPLPRNPWDVERWAGGSSSGTGSGLASGIFLGGIGTDTAGSVRLPAAFCGITGLKPTFGRVPKNGCVPLGYSYDTIGPMARSARDCAALLGVIAGVDPGDACSVDIAVPDYVAALSGSLDGVRIGVDRLAGVSPVSDPALSACLEEALEALADAGASVREVEIPLYAELVTTTMVGELAEAFAYHRGDLQTRWEDYGAGTRMVIASGALLPAADFVQAQRVRRVGQKAIATLFETVDLVITPTASVAAGRLDQLAFGDIIDAIHTPLWNGVGNPALSVPIGLTADGLPLAMQIAGAPFDEAGVLRAGDAYQRRTDWHVRRPPLHASTVAGAA
jgi:aspartyl-tRNA(Asn)/glutamyl-tRNA(Gln) amidotransferase subunit A